MDPHVRLVPSSDIGLLFIETKKEPRRRERSAGAGVERFWIAVQSISGRPRIERRSLCRLHR